jgi:hypothetical protein
MCTLSVYATCLSSSVCACLFARVRFVIQLQSHPTHTTTTSTRLTGSLACLPPLLVALRKLPKEMAGLVGDEELSSTDADGTTTDDRMDGDDFG